MNDIAVESISHAEILEEIAVKLWQVSIARLREGMRQLTGSGPKTLIICSPIGPVAATFLTNGSLLGVFIRVLGSPGWFTLVMPAPELFKEENQEREVNHIAWMSCDRGMIFEDGATA